jgi:hypothetical protein
LVGRNKQNVPKSTLKIIVKSKIKEVNSCEGDRTQKEEKTEDGTRGGEQRPNLETF